MSRFIRLIGTGSAVLGTLAALLLIIACVVVSWSVLVRYAFSASTYWHGEFVKYAVVAATLLGSPWVMRHGGHVGVDLFALWLSPAKRRVQQLIAGAMGLSFCVVLAYSAAQYFAEAWYNGWVTESVWAPPLWIVLAPFPLGVGWLSLQYLANLCSPPRNSNA